MEQWFFRITDYAQALLDDLETVDWPESIKARQRNWIGRSEGAEILFRIEELGRGRARLHDASGHALRRDVLRPRARARARRAHRLRTTCASTSAAPSAKKTEERAAATEKTGVFTGLHAINPVNGERLPVYVADYVLTDYGTGAIMAVPAHDQRDFDFAQAFGLPIRQVVQPADGEVDESAPTSSTRRARCSSTRASSTGSRRPRAAAASSRSSSERVAARFTINYRLRDWGFSRQRYWGCPIPVVYCDACGIVPVPDDELPVVLPEIEDYKPKGGRRSRRPRTG